MALTDEQRESVYRLVKNQPNYRPFFSYLAGLKLNLKESSLNVVETQSGLNHQHSLELMRQIAATGLARVHPGGRGGPSYLSWADDIDIREVGRSVDNPLR